MKVYEEPKLAVRTFSIEDVITESEIVTPEEDF